MLGSDMLDVAIGMVFVYLLLSLISSAINELIERQLKNRATDLEKGLRELLSDPDGSKLVKQVYDHGMVNGLFLGSYDPKAKDKSNLPSYIPSRNFALALLGIIAPDSSGAGSIASFQTAIDKIEVAPVKTALTALLRDAGNDVADFRRGIERWFDSSMDRVSGWYKRRSQLILVLLGFALAGVLNVNSISVANDLWIHKAQRDAFVAAAQGYLQGHPASATSPDPGLTADIDAFKSYGLPVGWKIAWGRGSVWWIWFVLVSLAGWGITGCAVSLGAPFWFDLLNKFVVVRSTLKPPETTKE
jgi:hypothetical protein